MSQYITIELNGKTVEGIQAKPFMNAPAVTA